VHRRVLAEASVPGFAYSAILRVNPLAFR